jgi:hypothetical protein
MKVKGGTAGGTSSRYEHSIMKPTKNCKIKGERRWNNKKLIKVQYLYEWKYHNETHLYN